jgi:hypothetical protein
MEHFLLCPNKDQRITLRQQIATDDANFVKRIPEYSEANVLFICACDYSLKFEIPVVSFVGSEMFADRKNGRHYGPNMRRPVYILNTI